MTTEACLTQRSNVIPLEYKNRLKMKTGQLIFIVILVKYYNLAAIFCKNAVS